MEDRIFRADGIEASLGSVTGIQVVAKEGILRGSPCPDKVENLGTLK